MQVKKDKFVVMNKGKPVPGNLVGSPAALEANATGNLDLVTTTTRRALIEGRVARLEVCTS